MRSGSDGLSTIFGAELRKLRARERFVLDGQRPSGLVSESIIQSWERCLSRGRSTHECVVPTLLPKQALKHSLRRSQKIVDAAEPALCKLDAALTHTGCVTSLLDPSGVVIHAGSEHPASGELVRQWCRVGVDLSEEAMGTSAPGIVMQSGGAAQVDCAEHYFAGHASIRCAAAPILDWHGGLAGILNIAVESRAFGFDAKEIVMIYAASIENRLLRMQPAGYRLIEFHLATDMIGSGFAGLAGFGKTDASYGSTASAHVCWASRARRIAMSRPCSELRSTCCTGTTKRYYIVCRTVLPFAFRYPDRPRTDPRKCISPCRAMTVSPTSTTGSSSKRSRPTTATSHALPGGSAYRAARSIAPWARADHVRVCSPA